MITAFLFRTALACAATISASISGFAAETCDGRIATTLQSIPEAIAFFGYGEQCRAYRLVTPHYNCSISYSFQHGPGGFSCGPALSGVWGARHGRSTGGALSVAGTDRKAALPEHREIRQQWLGPIDSEGVYKNYPVQADEYIDFYPRKFTAIGDLKPLVNEGAVQTYRYITMAGEPRAAVAGTVDARCVEVYFISWTSPEQALEAQDKMIAFLEDLRLEGIRLSSEDSAEMCRKPD